MSLFDVLSTANSALSAQTVRLNLTASNIANAESVAGTAEAAYKGRHAVFSSMVNEAEPNSSAQGVEVLNIVPNEAPAPRQYSPNHPLADAQGYVFGSNVNPIEEMADMISASRAYQNNVEVMNTSKEMLMRTLAIGR
jgi:flagellar basal-body rod protein FlgC